MGLLFLNGYFLKASGNLWRNFILDASSAWSLYKCKMFNCLHPTSLLTLLFFIFYFYNSYLQIWHLVSFLFIHDSLMWYLIIRTVFGFNTGECFKIQIIEKLSNHFSQTLYIMFGILQFHINLIRFSNVLAAYVLAYVLCLYIN